MASASGRIASGNRASVKACIVQRWQRETTLCEDALDGNECQRWGQSGRGASVSFIALALLRTVGMTVGGGPTKRSQETTSCRFGTARRARSPRPRQPLFRRAWARAERWGCGPTFDHPSGQELTWVPQTMWLRTWGKHRPVRPTRPRPGHLGRIGRVGRNSREILVRPCPVDRPHTDLPGPTTREESSWARGMRWDRAGGRPSRKKRSGG